MLVGLIGVRRFGSGSGSWAGTGARADPGRSKKNAVDGEAGGFLRARASRRRGGCRRLDEISSIYEMSWPHARDPVLSRGASGRLAQGYLWRV